MDDPADVSSQDGSGRYLLDEGSPTRNRKVVGSMMSREQLAEAVLSDVTHGVVPYLQEELVQQLGSCRSGLRPRPARPSARLIVNSAGLWAGGRRGRLRGR